MIKRYLGITLITATMLVAGCSSDDDDDGGTTAGDTTAGDTTAGDTTSGDTTAGDTTAGDTTAGDTTAGGTTGGIVGNDFVTGGTVTNNNDTTGRADAVIRVVHANNIGAVFVTADGANAAPLIGDPLDNTSGLTLASGAVGPVAIDAGDLTVEVIKRGDFLAGSFTPALSISDMTLGAGSSTTFIARGDAIDAGSSTPAEMVSVFNQTSTNSTDGGLVRIIHAARGLGIVFGTLVSGNLDIFATTDGVVNGTPAVSDFGYADVSTGYLELPAAVYQVVVTEAGNSANVRLTAEVDVSVGSVTTVIVRDGVGADPQLGVDSSLVVIDDTVNP